jgi:hypothetical protein
MMKRRNLIRLSDFGDFPSSHNTVIRVLLLIIPIKVIAPLERRHEGLSFEHIGHGVVYIFMEILQLED